MEYTKEAVRKQLLELAEPDYREFNRKLLPGVPDVLGVRMGNIRALAKKIARRELGEFAAWAEKAAGAGELCHEERLLWGLVIGLGSKTWQEAAPLVSRFVPFIDNWAVCDGSCGGLKAAGTCRREVWEFLGPYLGSEKEYENRFGAVMLLSYFADREYAKEGLKRLEGMKSQGYYAKMAAAWAVSVYYVKLPEMVLPYLKESRLDDWTYNKAIQKICESLRPSGEEKEMLRKMKRRGNGASNAL